MPTMDQLIIDDALSSLKGDSKKIAKLLKRMVNREHLAELLKEGSIHDAVNLLFSPYSQTMYEVPLDQLKCKELFQNLVRRDLKLKDMGLKEDNAFLKEIKKEAKKAEKATLSAFKKAIKQGYDFHVYEAVGRALRTLLKVDKIDLMGLFLADRGNALALPFIKAHPKLKSTEDIVKKITKTRWFKDKIEKLIKSYEKKFDDLEKIEDHKKAAKEAAKVIGEIYEKIIRLLLGKLFVSYGFALCTSAQYHAKVIEKAWSAWFKDWTERLEKRRGDKDSDSDKPKIIGPDGKEIPPPGDEPKEEPKEESENTPFTPEDAEALARAVKKIRKGFKVFNPLTEKSLGEVKFNKKSIKENLPDIMKDTKAALAILGSGLGQGIKDAQAIVEKYNKAVMVPTLTLNTKKGKEFLQRMSKEGINVYTVEEFIQDVTGKTPLQDTMGKAKKKAKTRKSGKKTSKTEEVYLIERFEDGTSSSGTQEDLVHMVAEAHSNIRGELLGVYKNLAFGDGVPFGTMPQKEDLIGHKDSVETELTRLERIMKPLGAQYNKDDWQAVSGIIYASAMAKSAVPAVLSAWNDKFEGTAMNEYPGITSLVRKVSGKFKRVRAIIAPYIGIRKGGVMLLILARR